MNNNPDGKPESGVKTKLKVYIISILIAFAAGTLSAMFAGGMKSCEKLIKPPLLPPAWVFPVAWTLLYILMGISAARVYLKKTAESKSALMVYMIQLIVNIVWTPLYFALKLRLAAFIWILVLLALIIIMILRFKAVDKAAAYLQIPYALWTAFAAYLNLGTYILNG